MPKVSSKLLEVACFNVSSCELAQKAGASRVEFCADYGCGGLTPTRDDVLAVRSLLKIPVHVIIRPRSGDFTYSESELRVMQEDIAFCRDAGIDGVVFGVLDRSGNVDVPACRKLIAEAGSMALTFHRAFDACNDRDVAMRELIALGMHRLLSSGGADTAMTGAPELRRLQQTYGTSITIMPGGSVRSSHLPELINSTLCSEYHSAALLSGTETVDETEIRVMAAQLGL